MRFEVGIVSHAPYFTNSSSFLFRRNSNLKSDYTYYLCLPQCIEFDTRGHFVGGGACPLLVFKNALWTALRTISGQKCTILHEFCICNFNTAGVIPQDPARSHPPRCLDPDTNFRLARQRCRCSCSTLRNHLWWHVARNSIFRTFPSFWKKEDSIILQFHNQSANYKHLKYAYNVLQLTQFELVLRSAYTREVKASTCTKLHNTKTEKCFPKFSKK